MAELCESFLFDLEDWEIIKNIVRLACVADSCSKKEMCHKFSGKKFCSALLQKIAFKIMSLGFQSFAFESG